MKIEIDTNEIQTISFTFVGIIFIFVLAYLVWYLRVQDNELRLREIVTNANIEMTKLHQQKKGK
jgi:hypothetical protein